MRSKAGSYANLVYRTTHIPYILYIGMSDLDQSQSH